MVHRHVRKDFKDVAAVELYRRVMQLEKTVEGHAAAMREIFNAWDETDTIFKKAEMTAAIEEARARLKE